MNKSIKIVIGIISALFFYNIIGKILIPSIKASSCKYDFIDGFDERYNFLFNDSIISQLKCFYSIGNEKGALFAYNYNNKYRFIIWEFAELNNINLSQIVFENANSNYDKNFEAYNSYNLGPEPAILIKSRLCINANKSVTIKIDGISNTVQTYKTTNFKGVFGEINKVEIENENGESQIHMNFGKTNNILCPKSELIIFKKIHSLFFVTISPLGKNQIYENPASFLKL